MVLALFAGSTTAAWWWPAQGAWIETAHLTPEDAHEDGAWGNSHWGVHFGSAVAIDKATMVAGTKYDRFGDGGGGPGGNGTDWAYVFEKSPDDGWHQTAKLVPNDAEPGDAFAWSLDIDSDSGTIVAGNPAAEKIHIFERTNGGGWIQTATFTAPANATESPGTYAYTVAVTGTTVATGLAPDLFLYEKENGHWTQAGSIPGGTYVDAEGDALVTSVWNEQVRRNEYALYVDQGEEWTEVARLDPASQFNDAAVGETDNTIGCSPSVNEQVTILVIGACIDRRIYGIPTEHEVQVGDWGSLPVSAGAIGSVWVYERIDGEWTLSADIPNPDPTPGPGDLFGLSVDASGERIVVGAPFDDNNGGRDGNGAAYVYKKVEDEWALTAKLRNHDNGPYGGKDVFGRSVGISGETIVAGAPFDDQRRDGTPSPADDDGDIPPCVHREILWGCDEGEMAGSVYVFQREISIDKG